MRRHPLLLISLGSVLFCGQSFADSVQRYTGPDDPKAIGAAQQAVSKLGPEGDGLSLITETRELIGLTNGVDSGGLALQAEIREARKTLADLGAEKSDLGYKLALSGDVLFQFDKAEIRTDAEEQLHKLATALQQLGKTTVHIVGHTDSKGGDTYNLKLSQERAEAVQNWLLARLPSTESHFTTEGKGEDEPVGSNTRPDGSDNPEGRARNRRVEIFITQEK